MAKIACAVDEIRSLTSAKVKNILDKDKRERMILERIKSEGGLFMKRVMIAYFSFTGRTEMMAQYIAEGIRISGQEAVARKIADIKSPDELAGYDGYIFGSPTYSLDVPEPMKKFLLAVEKAGPEGKLSGAFGSYTHDVSYKHDAYAPAIISNTLRDVCKMEPFELGSLILAEDVIDTGEGMKACHDYGRVFGEKLGS